MADVKRLNYFTSQFLVEKDFKDEQGYHLGMRRRHNQLLHTWGVADGGLQVTKSGDKIVSISAGMAIDKDGREIVLLNAQSKDLTTFGTNADVYITVKYQEVSDPDDHYTAGGVDNYTRTTERPLVEAGTTVPANDGSAIVLAKVKLDGSGNIGAIDGTVRKLAGSVIDPTVNLAAGSLSVTGNATVGGNVGIGTTTPGALLEIKGGDLLIKAAAEDPGDIIFQTASGIQKGRIWTNPTVNVTGLHFSSGDNTPDVTINASGNVGIGTTDPGAKLEINATTTTHGGWLEAIRFTRAEHSAITLPAAGLLFGLHSDRNFYFADVNGGFKKYVMSINAESGNVGIGKTGPADRLDVAGPLRILSGSNPIRFTSGWSGFPDAVTNQAEISNDTVTYKTLMIVGNKSSGEGVRKVSVWDRLEINGELRLAAGNRFYSPGRMHIFGEELLYLLNKSGVIIGKEWGGNGNLQVQGNLQVLGGKSGYVVDRFMNATGDVVEQGDVVVLGKNEASLLYGLNDNIPIPEVDLTGKVYDTRVCGIVCEVHVDHELLELERKQPKKVKDGSKGARFQTPRRQTFTSEELTKLDQTKVESSQIGLMVTLGAFAHCKVDADIATITVGDLLTTSPTKGHAQKVIDSSKAVGAIIGKALGALKKGKGKIPVLVMLQ